MSANALKRKLRNIMWEKNIGILEASNLVQIPEHELDLIERAAEKRRRKQWDKARKSPMSP